MVRKFFYALPALAQHPRRCWPVEQQCQLDEVLVRTQAGPSDGTVTEFVYNGEGNRVVKKVDGWVTVYVGQHYVCQGTQQALDSGGELACAKLIYANGQRIAMEQVGGKGTTYLEVPAEIEVPAPPR